MATLYMSIEEYIGDCVGRGVDLLDERIPNWREHIDYSSLEMESCTHCILGQVARGIGIDGDEEGEAFIEMTKRLGIARESGDYGFDLPENYEHIDPDYNDYDVWEALDEAWRGVLKP